MLGFICLTFLVVRVPVAYMQPGGQDEVCYAVPGMMVLRNRVASLPHVPARNAESVYYRADQSLFSEPPLTFYLQAVLFAVLPDQQGTARVVSILAGITMRLMRWTYPAVIHSLVALLLIGSLLPGIGLRTLFSHVRHFREVNYNAPAFSKELIESLSADSTFVVDTQLALDFVAAGRKTLWAQVLPKYFRADQFEYDNAIISSEGLDSKISEQLGGVLINKLGDRNDPFACYAEVYRASADPTRNR